MPINNQKLLEGEVVEPCADCARLRELNRHLNDELAAIQRENDDLKKRVSVAGAPVARLREKLDPFYKLLQSIFGDIDAIGPDPSPVVAGGSVPLKSSPIWDSWKNRMAGAPAKIIDALLLHADASVEQLVVLTQITRKKTIYDAIARMNKAGIINKNGGRFSLKQL